MNLSKFLVPFGLVTGVRSNQIQFFPSTHDHAAARLHRHVGTWQCDLTAVQPHSRTATRLRFRNAMASLPCRGHCRGSVAAWLDGFVAHVRPYGCVAAKAYDCLSAAYDYDYSEAPFRTFLDMFEHIRIRPASPAVCLFGIQEGTELN